MKFDTEPIYNGSVKTKSYDVGKFHFHKHQIHFITSHSNDVNNILCTVTKERILYLHSRKQ